MNTTALYEDLLSAIQEELKDIGPGYGLVLGRALMDSLLERIEVPGFYFSSSTSASSGISVSSSTCGSYSAPISYVSAPAFSICSGSGNNSSSTCFSGSSSLSSSSSSSGSIFSSSSSSSSGAIISLFKILNKDEDFIRIRYLPSEQNIYFFKEDDVMWLVPQDESDEAFKFKLALHLL